MHAFARAWVTWIGTHGGVASVTSSNYLDKAELFVREFLDGGGSMLSSADAPGSAAEPRPPGAFQVRRRRREEGGAGWVPAPNAGRRCRINAGAGTMSEYENKPAAEFPVRP